MNKLSILFKFGRLFYNIIRKVKFSVLCACWVLFYVVTLILGDAHFTSGYLILIKFCFIALNSDMGFSML